MGTPTTSLKLIIRWSVAWASEAAGIAFYQTGITYAKGWIFVKGKICVSASDRFRQLSGEL